jgi:hypothetical protein
MPSAVVLTRREKSFSAGCRRRKIRRQRRRARRRAIAEGDGSAGILQRRANGPRRPASAQDQRGSGAGIDAMGVQIGDIAHAVGIRADDFAVSELQRVDGPCPLGAGQQHVA